MDKVILTTRVDHDKRATGQAQQTSKPYPTSWGEDVQGLYRLPDGRWRITVPGKHFGERFTEPDERKAVQKAHELIGTQQDVMLGEAVMSRETDGKPVYDTPTHAAVVRAVAESGHQPQYSKRGKVMLAGIAVPKRVLVAWLREMLTDHPEELANMMGLPPRVFQTIPVPKPSLRLKDLVAAYERHNPASVRSKREALAALQRLIAFAEAKTLDDLTENVLLAFREKIETEVNGPATRKAYYSRIRYIISFGLKIGLDAVQIRACLDRCKVLWTAAPMPPVEPNPISREDFHTLLKAAGNGPWRAWLLVALNLCMSVEEVCGLRWEWFDLDAITFACIRERTRRKRIPRAAVLWDETLAVLKALPRRGPYVFVSRHGTRFNRNTRVNDFAAFRKAAGLPEGVAFSSLRDGSYTAAGHGTPDERQARVLAGHAAPGLADHYVLRNPQIVRPAVEAVYKAYGPFPTVK